MNIYIYGKHGNGKILTSTMRTTTDLVKVAEHYIKKWKEESTFDLLEFYMTRTGSGPKVFVTELDIDEAPIAYVGFKLWTLLESTFQSNFADEIEKKQGDIRVAHEKLIEEHQRDAIRESKKAKLLRKMSKEDKLILGL